MTTPSKSQRLGIIGGSFDPIHMAHLICAEAAREALKLDLVLFVPVKEQPLKSGRPVSSVKHRLSMVQLAIADNEHFALSRVDVERPGPSYTVDTLRLLREDWEGRTGGQIQMWFIIGTDSLATFPDWRDPEGILAQARLGVVRRPGSDIDMESLKSKLPQLENNLDWIDAPLIDISSTDLRSRAAKGRSIRYRVPEEVWEYIEINRLY